MRENLAITLTFAGFVVMGASGETEAQTTASEQPNILLLCVDSLRPDHLSFEGYGRRTSAEAPRPGRKLARRGDLRRLRLDEHVQGQNRRHAEVGRVHELPDPQVDRDAGQHVGLLPRQPPGRDDVVAMGQGYRS